MKISSPTGCPECGTSMTAATGQCKSCGCRQTARKGSRSWSPERMSTPVRLYTGFFIAWALVFPFLVPLIIKVSRAHM